MREIELLVVGFLLGVTDGSCPITLTPPTVAVLYGNPVKIVCSVTDSDYEQIGWEAPVGGTEPQSTSSSPNLTWSVPNLKWRITPECFINPPHGSPKKQCSKKAKVVVYDVPIVNFKLDRPVAREGDVVTVTCSVNISVPISNLTVVLNVDLPSPRRVFELPRRHFTMVEDLRVTRRNNYKELSCEAMIDLRPEGQEIKSSSQGIILTVLYGPDLSCNSTAFIPENTPYYKLCEAEGNPVPQIIWYKDGEEVQLPENLTRRYAGQYLVVATDSNNQTVNKTVEIIVTYGPDLACNSTAFIPENTPYYKLCEAEGNPVPQIIWYKDGEEVQLPENLTRRYAGQYLVVATDSNNQTVNKTVEIIVTYGPDLACNSTAFIPENTPYYKLCEAEGNPVPQIIWYKDGEEVQLPENLTRRDAGQYLVVATDSNNQTVNKTVEIIVTYPPSLILELDDSEVEVGSSVQLKCSSTANPRPEYSWTYFRAHNIVELHEDGVSLLLVENATEHNMGVYTCHAGNFLGNISQSATVTVKALHPPAGLECPIEIVPERLVVGFQEKGRRVTCRPTTTTNSFPVISWLVLSGVEIPGAADWSPHFYTDWEEDPVCHATFQDLYTCQKSLDFTLYKMPDGVSVSSAFTVDAEGSLVNHLICDVTNVAPAKSLRVRWYQGNETLDPGYMAGGLELRGTGCGSNTGSRCDLDTTRTPMNVSGSVRLHLNRTTDLAAIRCQALLDLDLEKGPGAMMSDPVNISVYYKPVINTTKLPKTIPVFEGYPEDLVCEAEGHPPPEVRWEFSSEKVDRVSRGTIRVREPGVYNCSASNMLDSTSHLVHVILKEDYLPLIAGLVALTVVIISIIFIFIYSIYYTNTKMRRYSLKNAKLDSHNGNVAHNGWDLPLPMTKLS